MINLLELTNDQQYLIITKIIPFARKIVGTLGTIFKFNYKLLTELNPENFIND